MAEETTTIVIMGVTGDLARRKLLPALFQLGCKGRLPKGLRVVGFARRDYSDDQFREFMWDGVQEFGDLAVRRDEWAEFAQQLFYVGGNLDAPEDFIRLRQRLQEMEGGDGTANRLFYLSIGPQLFGTTVKNLGASGLAGEDGGWRRVVIEKPFGKDLESAQSLNRAVQRYLRSARYTASTTTWVRRRCRTCWFSALPMAYSSHCGTATMWTTCRLPRQSR